jgi:hypothetical protein
VGQVIQRLLSEFKSAYGGEPTYQVLERLFRENFNLVEEQVQVKPNEQIGAGCLQSLDDQEATFRRKGPAEFKGYSANLSQTCHPDNEVQLITKVQVAPNDVDDADLLVEAIPDLKQRTGVEDMITDGGYGSPAADDALNEYKITLTQTGLRGKAPLADKLSLSQFNFTVTEHGKPITITCPTGQKIAVEPGRTTGYLARFDPLICQSCSFAVQNRCRATQGKKDPAFKLLFTQQEVNWARRRQRFEASHQPGKNPRAAIEAVMRAVKHPFPAGKLPVRGRFRVACMIIASAAMANLRCITRYKLKKVNQKPDNPVQPDSAASFFSPFFPLQAIFRPFSAFAWTCFSC